MNEAEAPGGAHAPKNGFLYILDRRDGTLLSAKPIVRQNWTKGIDPKTGKPIPNPEAADYSTGPKIVFPATPGARNWHPASYDPVSGRLMRRRGGHGQPDVHDSRREATGSQGNQQRCSTGVRAGHRGRIARSAAAGRRSGQGLPALPVEPNPIRANCGAIDPLTGET
ncbi:MAG: hypothetical protein R3D89_13970 [Sphingomonadaceae bacterium]